MNREKYLAQRFDDINNARNTACEKVRIVREMYAYEIFREEKTVRDYIYELRRQLMTISRDDEDAANALRQLDDEFFYTTTTPFAMEELSSINRIIDRLQRQYNVVGIEDDVYRVAKCIELYVRENVDDDMGKAEEEDVLRKVKEILFHYDDDDKSRRHKIDKIINRAITLNRLVDAIRDVSDDERFRVQDRETNKRRLYDIFARLARQCDDDDDDFETAIKRCVESNYDLLMERYTLHELVEAVAAFIHQRRIAIDEARGKLDFFPIVGEIPIRLATER